MPGRANLMSAADAYKMTPTRWQVPVSVLANKKALNTAFQQHVWGMQQQAKQLASGEKKQRIAGEYGLKQQELRGGGAESKLADRAANYTTQILKNSFMEPGTQEYQEAWKRTYQMILPQIMGSEEPGAMAMAGAEAMPGPAAMSPGMDVPAPVGMLNPMRALPSHSYYGVQEGAGRKLDARTARTLLRKANGDKEKARAMAKKLGYTF